MINKIILMGVIKIRNNYRIIINFIRGYRIWVMLAIGLIYRI
jgi:hypothetical protein